VQSTIAERDQMFKTTSTSKTTSSTNAVTRKMAGLVSDVKETVSDLGKRAENEMDSRRKATACTLEDAASALHRQGKACASIAHSAAGKLSSTAKYVRRHRVRNMVTDVGQFLKKNAGPSFGAFAAVGFAGFLMARSFRKS
jgi:ElaB/YqjD/DUF883 family membrane-anchored ribosome-binding protein